MAQPGPNFGKYQLLDRIAAGGMAEIFRARFVAAAGVTKSVVIKRILPHYAGNSAFVSMFINEAKIACSLSHGNIAQIFDFGEIDGEYFLAMEYVQGQALNRLMRKAQERGFLVPTPIAVYIASELCAGLHYAHTRTDENGRPLGIIHRDVSPQNVIVSYEGQVKIVDFGIAKARSAGLDNTKTQTGAMKGKYVYFSPEQARGKPLDARTDVFATGIVIYEMLVGRRPFEGKVIEVLGHIAKGEFDRPSAANPDIPRELEAIVLRAMAQNPDSRYTAMQLHDALRQYLFKAEPRFSPAWVGHFVTWLCKEELNAEGGRATVPEEFIDLMERWRNPAQVTRAAENAARITSEVGTEEMALPSRRKLPSKWLAVGVGAVLLAGALGALAVPLLKGPRTFALEVATVPSGAAVLVDGDETGKLTPARVEGLRARTAHRVKLLLEGRKPIEVEVPPQSGDKAELRQVFEIDAVSPPQAQPEAARDDLNPPDDPVEPGPVVHGTETIITLPGRMAVSIPASAAARVRLDPRKTYRLSSEGMAMLGGPGSPPLKQVLYFGERASGVSAEGSFGALGPGQTERVSGLRALYAFIFDDSSEDNSGSLKLWIAEEGRGKRRFPLLVDPAQNVIVPTARLGRFTGLDPRGSYLAKLGGQVDLGAGGGAVRRLFYFQSGLTKTGQGVLVSGEPLEVQGAKDFWLLLPDDDPADNAGELLVRLVTR